MNMSPDSVIRHAVGVGLLLALIGSQALVHSARKSDTQSAGGTHDTHMSPDIYAYRYIGR